MPFQLYQYCAFCSVQWQKTRGSVRKTRRLTLNWSDYFQVFFFFLRNDYFHVEYNHTSEIWPYGSDILIGGHMSLIMIYNLQFSNNNTCVNFFFFLRINTCVNYLLVFVHKIIIVFFIFLFYMYNLTLFSEIGMKTLFSKTINASQVWPCHQFKKKKKWPCHQLTKSVHEIIVIIFWIALYLLGIIHWCFPWWDEFHCFGPKNYFFCIGFRCC